MPTTKYTVIANHPISSYQTKIVFTKRAALDWQSYFKSLGYEVTIEEESLIK